MTARDEDYAKFLTNANQASLIMPEQYVVYGCSSVCDIPNGIGFHKIPIRGGGSRKSKFQKAIETRGFVFAQLSRTIRRICLAKII